MASPDVLEIAYATQPGTVQQYSTKQVPAELSGIREIHVTAPYRLAVRLNDRNAIKGRDVSIGHKSSLTVGQTGMDELTYIHPTESSGPLVKMVPRRSRLRFIGGGSLVVYGVDTDPRLDALANPETVGKAEHYYDQDWVEIDGKRFTNIDSVKILAIRPGAKIELRF